MQNIAEDPNPALMDNLVSFLLGFITKPTDREVAEEYLWDMTEQQFMDLLAQVGNVQETTVPEVSGGESNSSTSQK